MSTTTSTTAPHITADMLDLSSRDAIIEVKDGNTLHISFLLATGQILVVEHIPENYPQTELVIFEDGSAYLEAVKNVDWVTDAHSPAEIAELIEEMK